MIDKFDRGWLWAIGVLVAVLAIAFFLRTYNLTSLPIFADEAIYIRWAQVMKAESTLRFLPLSDGKQPLFMWTAIPFLKVFTDPLVAGRMVSVFAGVTSLAGVFLLTHRLFNSKTAAVFAALLYAVSPFSVFFDRMALVDSMLSALGIWSLYLGVLTVQTMRIDLAMLTGFALGAAWLTKSPAIFFLLLLPATALVLIWPKGKGKFLLHGFKLLGLWAISWFIAFVLYNVQRLGPNFHMLAERNKDYIFTFEEALIHPLDPLQFHIREIGEWMWTLLPGGVLVIAFFSILFCFKKYWKEILLLLSWIVFPLLVQAEFAQVFTARYILFAVPPVIVLASISSIWFLEKFRTKKAILVVFVLLLISPSLWFNFLVLKDPQLAPLPRVERSGYLEEWTAGTGIREVAEYLKNEIVANPNSKFVVGTEGFFGTLPDGLQIYFEKVPNITIIGIGVYISNAHPRLVDAKKAGNKVYFVINSTRYTGNAEKDGLRLIDSYPKAFRPNGSQEELLFFEVTDKSLLPKTQKSSN